MSRISKKIPKILIFLLIVVSIAGIAYNFCIFLIGKSQPPNEEVILIIPEGASAKSIGEMLEEHQIIGSSTRFILFTKIKGQEKRIKAGRYIFNKGMGARSALRILVAGKTKSLTVMIPEGLTIDEIATIVVEKLDIDRDAFIALASDRAYARKRGLEGENFEGFLFPNTYKFNSGATEKHVIERLVGGFWNIFDDSLKQRARELGFSVYEVVTLASLIEEEAMLERENPIVSQVYHKRLQLGRALECDATIQYALEEHKSRLLYKDLKIESPYNTYIHKGLPPGPIANPGRSAILAALYPAHTEYLYYVAKGDGSHIFSRTAKEHYKAIASVRRKSKK